MKSDRKPLVLIVDDDETVRVLLQMQMELDGYGVASAEDGEAGVRKAKEQEPDIVLLDALMPGMDGFQAAEALKSDERTRSIPLIMVTAMNDRESRLRALRAGAQEFLSKPIDRSEVSLRVRNMLALREYGKFLADQNRSLGTLVEEQSRTVLASYRETIETLIRAASYKDDETGGHIRRISYYTRELAATLGMNAGFCETIHYASQMHDIGKIAIPDAILRKPGPLTHDEWEIMKTHTTLGARLIGRRDSPYLQMGAEIALHHHEQWDGGGYPGGLRGQVIPISARIMKICDQYDTLLSERPYKQGLSHADALEVITVGDSRSLPSHLDPDVLQAFIRCAERFRDIYESIVA